MASFDLSTLKVEDVTVVALVHPTTGDEIGATITVYGQDSDTYKAEQRKAESKFAEYMRKHNNKPMPPEDRERMDKAKVVTCIKTIDNLDYAGQPMSAAEAMAVPWIYEQVTAAMFDRSLFIKG